MKIRTLLALLIAFIAAFSLVTIRTVRATEVTLTLSDAELSTQFAYKWGPGTLTSIEDIPGLGVRFNFTGLGSSGTGVCDDFPVSSLAGGEPDNIGGYGDFRKYTQYRLVFTNLGPNPVSVNIDMNTGWTNVDPARDTYWENSWTYLDVGESKVVTLDFSSAICWNAQDDPVSEWRYPGGTNGVIVRRLSEVSRIGFQVCGNGEASIVVSAVTPKDTVVSLSDEELSTQFAKETGPGTVLAVTDVPGPGVRFDFSGLSTSVGTVVGDNFPVSALAGGAWKDYGSGFAGPYDFSGYDRFSLLFTNVGTMSVTINLKINTGWTNSPWGTPEKDTFWQNGWTTIGPGESRIVTLDFWSAEVWNAEDDPVSEWRYPDGTTGVIVRRLDEVSDIGFQILGDGEASIIVSGDFTLSLSDEELSTQFAKETGPGTVLAVTDVPGPGVRFDFSGLSTSVGTVVGDNFPVSALAGGAYKTYGVTQQFSTWGDFSGYVQYEMFFINVGTTAITVNLKINTGWTVTPPEYAKAWRDTFWQNEWTTIAPGETKAIILNFSSAEVWNAADEQEYKAYPDGTTGVAIWRLDEVSDIGFQILAEDTASVIVSAIPQASHVYVDDDYTSSTPGWGYDHFASIQDGISAVADGGTVTVYEGTYTEQLVINKNLALQGMTGAKIVAPDTRSTFTIPESGSTFDPIIFAYGSLTGTGTISVTIMGFEIDGGNKASAYPIRFVGILCRNVKPAVISNNVVHSMYPPSGKGSGPETCAILVYGDSEAEIYHNEVRDFSRVGIGVLGDAGPSVDPVAVIQENEVFGNGLETETGWWAENGIQVAYGASGYIVGNEVFNCTVNNPNWASTGILVVDTDGVTVDSNYVEGCDVGIGAVDFPASYGPPWDYAILSNIDITGNTLIGNAWQIDISNDAQNITVTYNDIINATANGIDVWSYFGDVYPTNVRIHYNNIEGSGSYGIWASDELAAQPVDARFNWWGDPTGPYHATNWTYMGEPYGPHYGLGDNVTDYVLYDPWQGKIFMRTEPVSYQAKRLNETFSINVTIHDVDAAWKIIGIQFRLTYNNTLLQLVNVTEGPFMKQFGDTFLMVVDYPDDPLYGTHVAVGILLLPNATGQWNIFPEGGGVLATVTFKVVYQHVGLENPPLSCNLTLIDTMIIDEELATITHETQGSHYQVLPNNIADINWDYKVNMKDLGLAALAFGTSPGDERWNPAADIIKDDKINMRDLALIARNFGWVQDPDP